PALGVVPSRLAKPEDQRLGGVLGHPPHERVRADEELTQEPGHAELVVGVARAGFGDEVLAGLEEEPAGVGRGGEHGPHLKSISPREKVSSARHSRSSARARKCASEPGLASASMFFGSSPITTRRTVSSLILPLRVRGISRTASTF